MKSQHIIFKLLLLAIFGLGHFNVFAVTKVDFQFVQKNVVTNTIVAGEPFTVNITSSGFGPLAACGADVPEITSFPNPTGCQLASGGPVLISGGAGGCSTAFATTFNAVFENDCSNPTAVFSINVTVNCACPGATETILSFSSNVVNVQCLGTPQFNQTHQSLNACDETPLTFSVANVSGASSFSWTFPTGWTVSGANNGQSITLVPDGIHGGEVTCTASNGFISTSSSSNVVVVGGPSSSLNVNTCSNCEALTVGGSILVDANGSNNGTFTGTNDDLLKFGACGTGEAIGSKRTSGGNQFGLDFYTDFTNRMSVTNTGNVGIGTTSPANPLDVNGSVSIGNMYAGSITAPPNGMLVQGSVGIGQSFSSLDAALNVSGPALWIERGDGRFLTGAGPGINMHYDAINNYGAIYSFNYGGGGGPTSNEDLILQLPDPGISINTSNSKTYSNVGIGTEVGSTIYDKLDVNGTVRVQYLPTPPTALVSSSGCSPALGIVIYGPGNPSQESNQLQSLPFDCKHSDWVLYANGGWGPITTGSGGNTGKSGALNGNSVDDNTNVVLGEEICNSAAKFPAQLLSYREVPMNDYSINFADNETLSGSGFSNAYSSSIAPGGGNPNSQGRIGIGLACGIEPGAKLDIFRPQVNDESNPIGLKVVNTDMSTLGSTITSSTPTPMGIGADITAVTTNSATEVGVHGLAVNGALINEGIMGEAITTAGTALQPYDPANVLMSTIINGPGSANIGGSFYATGNSNANAGIFAFGDGGGSASASAGGIFSGVNSTGQNIGVNCTADGTIGAGAIGGSFSAANASSYNVGIYAQAGPISSAPTVPSSSNCAAFIDGDAYIAGVYGPSDEKLKTNIQDFQNALDMLKKLNAKTYEFKADEYKGSLYLPQGNQIGIMAKNMQTVFPGLVKEKTAPVHKDAKSKTLAGEDTKFLAVNYLGLVPVLVAAVNELNLKTDSIAHADSVSILKTALDNTNADLANTKVNMGNQIAALQKQLDDICTYGCAGLNGSNTNDQSVSPANKLLQNVPNPFAQQTTIGYVINVGTTAYLLINGLDGKQLKQIPLAVNGAGSVIINSNELASGTYTYTLVVDGKIVDTKLMVITAKD